MKFDFPPFSGYSDLNHDGVLCWIREYIVDVRGLQSLQEGEQITD
jgi:hypothetical protein